MATTRDMETSGGALAVTRYAGPSGTWRIEVQAPVDVVRGGAHLSRDQAAALRDLLHELLSNGTDS